MRTHGISEAIKEQIAKAMAAESHPGFSRHYMGESFVVDTDGDQVFDAVWRKEPNEPWNPWPDSATALPITALFEHCAGDVDFSPALDPEESEGMTEEERSEAEDLAQEAAELLALEYMPEYYPPNDW